MDLIVKKYKQHFRRIKDEMGRWEELQSRLIAQFSNASAIIQRLQVILDSRNYGALKCVECIEDALLEKQMGTLRTIFDSIQKIMEEFRKIVASIEKIVRDGRHLVKMGSAPLTEKQLNQRIGIKPTLAYCLDALRDLEEMHQSEYQLKLSMVSALSYLASKPGESGDVDALQKLLADQPNIPREEVQEIYDIIFAEENLAK